MCRARTPRDIYFNANNWANSDLSCLSGEVWWTRAPSGGAGVKSPSQLGEATWACASSELIHKQKKKKEKKRQEQGKPLHLQPTRSESKGTEWIIMSGGLISPGPTFVPNKMKDHAGANKLQ